MDDEATIIQFHELLDDGGQPNTRNLRVRICAETNSACRNWFWSEPYECKSSTVTVAAQRTRLRLDRPLQPQQLRSHACTVLRWARPQKYKKRVQT